MGFVQIAKFVGACGCTKVCKSVPKFPSNVDKRQQIQMLGICGAEIRVSPVDVKLLSSKDNRNRRDFFIQNLKFQQ